MKDSECPKCGETVKPKWHAFCSDIKYISVSPIEHLHYFCQCGYDFIKPVLQEEMY